MLTRRNALRAKSTLERINRPRNVKISVVERRDLPQCDKRAPLIENKAGKIALSRVVEIRNLGINHGGAFFGARVDLFYDRPIQTHHRRRSEAEITRASGKKLVE